METLSAENENAKQDYQFDFRGNGSEYFTIMIVNWLLTLITLGFYYPWAKAKKLRYMYGQTSLNNERFHFAGTGKEMFQGFIKVIIFYIAVMAIYITLLTIIENPVMAVLFIYLAIFAIVPFAIHGSLRYKMSRTSYRGIRFGYRGDRNELVKSFYKWAFLTLITLGIYGAWLEMKVRSYTHKNIRYGNIEFSNNCNGGDWFILNLSGYLLTLITLGIYFFWWQKNIFNYYVDNMKMSKNDQNINCYSTATGGGFFSLLMGNLLLTVFTLGFGKAWADIRTQKFIFENIKLDGNINIDDIPQTEVEYTNAIGDDTMDFLDIDLA